MLRHIGCLTLVGLFGALDGSARGQEPNLAHYYGFQGLEVVKVGRNAGPMTTADMDGDGFLDLIVVNNHASRIEVHYQKPGATPQDQITPTGRVNELPEHWRFRRQELSVSHRVSAVVPFDFDDDGKMDLIYAGIPPELVFMRQSADGEFRIERRHRVKKLATNRDGLAIANILGDETSELLALVDGEIHIWTLDGTSLDEPLELSADARIVAFRLEDYNGDGRTDIAAISPDDRAPIRLWLGENEDGLGVLGPQRRFEMPPLIEFEPVRLPGQPAAHLAVIERVSKRLALYELSHEQVEPTGDQDAAMLIHGFEDAGNRKRDVAVVDVDGDGLLDLVATNTQANALVVYRQVQGKGFQPGESYPCYADVDYLAAGNIDTDASAELFVLSEKEGVVGWSDETSAGVPYTSPLRAWRARPAAAI